MLLTVSTIDRCSVVLFTPGSLSRIEMVLLYLCQGLLAMLAALAFRNVA